MIFSSGIKNSLSTPSRLGISTEELGAKEIPKPQITEDNLLGGAAAEFEGAEGLSPPKSSRITGVAASLGDGRSTPMATPCGTPQKPVMRGKGLHGSMSSISSALNNTRDVNKTSVAAFAICLFFCSV